MYEAGEALAKNTNTGYGARSAIFVVSVKLWVESTACCTSTAGITCALAAKDWEWSGSLYSVDLQPSPLYSEASSDGLTASSQWDLRVVQSPIAMAFSSVGKGVLVHEHMNERTRAMSLNVLRTDKV